MSNKIKKFECDDGSFITRGKTDYQYEKEDLLEKNRFVKRKKSCLYCKKKLRVDGIEGKYIPCDCQEERKYRIVEHFQEEFDVV